MIRPAAFLTFLVLAGCAASGLQAADPGAEFILAPGATAAVQELRATVRFIGVLEDSRCPSDTNCIWAGQVRLNLAINDAPLEVSEGGSTVAGGLRVTLVRVLPRPVSTAPIAPQNYRATLKLEKAG